LESVDPAQISLIWNRITDAVEQTKRGMRIQVDPGDDFEGVIHSEIEFNAKYPAEGTVKR
jgi:hypothetical protein